MKDISYYLSHTFFGIEASDWLLALACLAGGYVLRVVCMAVLRRIVHLTAKTETSVDDILIEAISKPVSALCFVLGLWAAYEVLPLSNRLPELHHLVRALIKAATVWIAIWFFLRLIDRSAAHMREKAVENRSPMLEFVPLFRRTAKIVFVLIGVVIIFQELGYSVTSLVAGLGLGGLALGLAAKDTLANFFGSVVVFVDRPFVIGDWIKIGEHEGIVEDISIRVTRIRTFTDQLITVPNSQLTTTAITNNSAMRKRRVKFTLEIPYDTPPGKVEQAVLAIRKLILADSRFHPDPVVAMNEIGTYSLNILVVCFTMSTNYQDMMTAQQDLMLAVVRSLQELDIVFAYPTQTMQYNSSALAANRPSVATQTTREL